MDFTLGLTLVWGHDSVLSSRSTNQANMVETVTRSFPELEALDASTARELSESEEESEEDLFYDYYKSPCLFEASNDAYSPEKIDAFEVCQTNFYGGCHEDLQSLETSFPNDDLLEVNILFDYELRYRNRANVTRTIQHLEGTVLEHLATVIGLSECDESGGDRQRLRRKLQQARKDYIHHFSDEQIENLLGISHDPLDSQDPDFGK